MPGRPAAPQLASAPADRRVAAGVAVEGEHRVEALAACAAGAARGRRRRQPVLLEEPPVERHRVRQVGRRRPGPELLGQHRHRVPALAQAPGDEVRVELGPAHVRRKRRGEQADLQEPARVIGGEPEAAATASELRVGFSPFLPAGGTPMRGRGGKGPASSVSQDNAAWLPTGCRRRRRAGLRPAMPPEAAASDRGSSTRSGGTSRGPRICGPGRLCSCGHNGRSKTCATRGGGANPRCRGRR